MNTHILALVRKHYVHELAPRHVQRHNIRQWVKSVRMLGDKWLLAVPVQRT